MSDKFNAELVTRSETSAAGKLEVDLVDAKGCCQRLSLSPEVATALLDTLSQYAMSQNAQIATMTKLPKTFSVGHGRHEPLVLLRFETDAAYALSSDQAIELSEALFEEAQSTCAARYACKQ